MAELAGLIPPAGVTGGQAMNARVRAMTIDDYDGRTGALAGG